MSVVDERDILHDENLDDLYNWIDGIPLSRPKKHIGRDFSDGVLCAEIIAHFQPKYVDMHNYFPASSSMQKKINWNTLNRKVFSKLGIRLSDATIQQLIEAKPGGIEQLLWDIKRKMEAEGRHNEHENEYRGRRMESSERSEARARSAENSYERRSMAPVTPLTYRQSCHVPETDEPPIDVIRPVNRNSTGHHTSQFYRPPTAPTGHHGGYTNAYNTQGYIAPPSKLSTAMEASNNNSAVPPSQIIYRGHKMIPLAILEEREREIKSLEQANKTLLTKVGRIETLVGLKDQRIEDLTHQLHNVRTMYERVTNTTYAGY